METMKDKPRVIQDMIRAIDNDEWMWIVCWGEPRSGKSTLCMRLCYEIYGDWDKVLDAIAFNLSGTIYKIRHGQPELWPTRNLLHDRIPVLMWDDFGAYSNKAITQYDRGWDVFKGAFDTLGTKIAILLANMVSPFSPTQQLQNKYTHELWVPYKGRVKYDRVHAQQDYRGWNPMARKEWIQEFDFPEVPKDIFKQYDEARMGLADEVLQTVEDQIVDTHLHSLLPKIQPLDVQLLELIEDKGALDKRELESDLQQVVTRLKSRQLITPVKISAHYYKLDITNLGLEVLKAIREQVKEKQKVPSHIITPQVKNG